MHQEQIKGWSSILNGEDTLLSRMADGRTIEPLTGIARHPFANVGCRVPYQKTSIFDTSYIRIPNVCNLETKPTAKVFDMGCSVYGNGHTNTASGYDFCNRGTKTHATTSRR